MFKGLLNNLWVLRWEEEEEGGGWGARVEKEESKLTAVEEHGLPGCFVDKELGRGVDFQAGSMGGGEEEAGEYGQGAHHKGCLQHHLNESQGLRAMGKGKGKGKGRGRGGMAEEE